MSRKRLYFDVEEDLKIAVELERLKAGDDSVSAFLGRVLGEMFPESLKEARKMIAQRKKKRGEAEG